MQIHEYFERVRYRGSGAPTLETLNALHRAHVFNIPYENLDIHLGRTLHLDSAHIFQKLVRARRGGWCYEMNGVFAWALRELGFRVKLLAGTVVREGVERMHGDHLVLLVELDQPYVADVGFGDGLIEPLPLVQGTYQQRFLEFRLEHRGERWLFHNHEYGGARCFDFDLVEREIAGFAMRCTQLQTAPSSGFVQKTVVQRFTDDGLVTLRGAVLRTVTATGISDHVITSAPEFDHTLRAVFDLQIPEAEQLWERVWQRHLVWVQSSSHPRASPD